MAKYLRFINLMNVNKGCERLQMDYSLLTDTPTSLLSPAFRLWRSPFPSIYYELHLGAGHGYITNSQCDQLPDGLIDLIAQLVERCTVSQRSVMGSNPVQA